jgi:Ser/Thr protein kinase RdoA (MazF antagonist)
MNDWFAPPPAHSRRWETPRVLLTQDSQTHWVDSQGQVWRGISFIPNTTTFDTIPSTHHAQEIGYGLGMFHTLISDLPAERLADTLEGFHITPRYLAQYEAVQAKSRQTQTPELTHCLKFVCDRKSWVSVLETAKAAGKLPLRLMHGDPKINNILFDRQTEQAISLIDLDTVKPGLIQYDIGDCLRSGCNLSGEETQQWETVRFETDLCQAILSGYCSVAQTFLTDHDYLYLFDAIRLIAFELGLRFLTDYLAGDIYFKTTYPGHNLIRALVQFQLTASIEAQEAQIGQLVQDLQRGRG